MQFAKTRRLMLQLYRQQQDDGPDKPVDATNTDSVSKLHFHLKGVLECTEAMFLNLSNRPPAASGIMPRELTRALTLSGNGERFELAVESVIRSFCAARDDVRRYASAKDVPDDLRDDIVAGFTRVMEEHRVDLHYLDVAIEEIETGTPLDIDRHDVVKKVASRSLRKANTVCECVSPAFRWKNGEGVERIRPAKVSVYSAQKRNGEEIRRKGRFF